MSATSPIPLKVDDFEEFEGGADVRRARSGGHLDDLDNEEAWKSQDEARQMFPYHGRNRSGASTRRTSADRSTVPKFEGPPRLQRATSYIRAAMRDSDMMEIQSEPGTIVDLGSMSNPDLQESAILRGSTHAEVPMYENERVKLPTVVLKENSHGFKISHLVFKYLQLQSKLTDVALACKRYNQVEAANSQDLTFEKLSEQVTGFVSDLRLWYRITNMQNLAQSNLPEGGRDISDAASRAMDRLIDRAEALHNACSNARPDDLKFDELPEINDDNAIFDDIADEV
jgi:hypothetical protein